MESNSANHVRVEEAVRGDLPLGLVVTDAEGRQWVFIGWTIGMRGRIAWFCQTWAHGTRQVVPRIKDIAYEATLHKYFPVEQNKELYGNG